jgi:hypothetical protein
MVQLEGSWGIVAHWIPQEDRQRDEGQKGMVDR